jgi:hypothetical protein
MFHILHRQSAVNYCVNKIKLKLLLVQNLMHKFICVCLIAHILNKIKVKYAKMDAYQNVCMFESHIKLN